MDGTLAAETCEIPEQSSSSWNFFLDLPLLAACAFYLWQLQYRITQDGLEGGDAAPNSRGGEVAGQLAAEGSPFNPPTFRR